MRRTKEWWACLEPWERSHLVHLERAQYRYGSGWNLPEGYSECSSCGNPTSGSLCSWCCGDLSKYIRKANEMMQARGR